MPRRRRNLDGAHAALLEEYLREPTEGESTRAERLRARWRETAVPQRQRTSPLTHLGQRVASNESLEDALVPEGVRLPDPEDLPPGGQERRTFTPETSIVDALVHGTDIPPPRLRVIRENMPRVLRVPTVTIRGGRAQIAWPVLAGDFVVGWEVAGQLTSLSPPERHLIVTDGEFIVDIDARQLRLGLDGPGLRPEDWAVQEQLDPETVGTVAQTELVPTYNAQAEALNVVLSLIDGETAMPSDEFIESIRTQGQLVPVLLRRSDDGRFVIVDGRRRVRALRRLGVPAVAARVLPMAARGAPEWAAAITANFQRSPNPIGEYEAVNSLIALGWDVARIAGDLRIPEYRVRERLALGNLTADARGLFTSRRMAVTTATRLARLTATQQAQAIDHFRQRAVGVPRLTMRDINAILPPRVDPRQRDLEDVDETGADSDGRMTQAEWREADAEWRAARRAEDASRATVVGLEDTEPGWPRVLVALRIAEENIPVAPDGRIERLFDQITEWIERVQRIVSRPDPDESSDAVERAIGAMVDDTARQAAAGRRQANPH